MKLIKIIGHPVFLIFIYLLLLIEGNESYGNFYIVYITMALQQGILYAKVAAAGLLFVFIGYVMQGRYLQPIKASLYLAGLILMILSLFVFFHDGKKSATFELFIPTMTFILFSISSICFVVSAVMILVKAFQQKLA